MDTTVMPAAPSSGLSSIEAQRDEWFSKMFHSLNTDKLLLETKTASKEKTAFYDAMMSTDPVISIAEAKKVFNQQLTQKALIDFIVRVFASEHQPRKIAFNIADSSLLVWAVVADDDFSAEKSLYLTQAALNAELSAANYRVSTTVVEEGDHLPTPLHYQELPLPKQLADQQ